MARAVSVVYAGLSGATAVARGRPRSCLWHELYAPRPARRDLRLYLYSYLYLRSLGRCLGAYDLRNVPALEPEGLGESAGWTSGN